MELENNNDEIKEQSVDDLETQLAQEQEKVASYEKKLQYLLADFEQATTIVVLSL